jgi:hypothetical protein
MISHQTIMLLSPRNHSEFDRAISVLSFKLSYIAVASLAIVFLAVWYGGASRDYSGYWLMSVGFLHILIVGALRIWYHYRRAPTDLSQFVLLNMPAMFVLYGIILEIFLVLFFQGGIWLFLASFFAAIWVALLVRCARRGQKFYALDQSRTVA